MEQGPGTRKFPLSLLTSLWDVKQGDSRQRDRHERRRGIRPGWPHTPRPSTALTGVKNDSGWQEDASRWNARSLLKMRTNVPAFRRGNRGSGGSSNLAAARSWAPIIFVQVVWPRGPAAGPLWPQCVEWSCALLVRFSDCFPLHRGADLSPPRRDPTPRSRALTLSVSSVSEQLSPRASTEYLLITWRESFRKVSHPPDSPANSRTRSKLSLIERETGNALKCNRPRRRLGLRETSN